MYDDIIDYDYPFDLGHPRMSLYERCSQFMPFSALTGYKEAVSEVSRLTSEKIILDNETKEILDEKLNFISSNLSLKPFVNIVYFISDSKKNGGSYNNISGIIKKIDSYNNVIVINGVKISFDDILDINYEIKKID